MQSQPHHDKSKKGFNKKCNSLREWRDGLKKESKVRQIWLGYLDFNQRSQNQNFEFF